MSSHIVEISGSKGRVYTVDLQEYTCTCPDWRNRRSKMDTSWPERLCKHLVKAVCDNGLAGEFPDVDLQALAKKKKGTEIKEVDYMELFFGQELSPEERSRVEFLFGGGSARQQLAQYAEIVQEGANLVWVPEDGKMRVSLERMVWLRLAVQSPILTPEEYLSCFSLPTLKKMCEALGEKAGQRKTAIKLLSDSKKWADALYHCNISVDDFFLVKPLAVDDLS